jgi:hypothetical protein
MAAKLTRESAGGVPGRRTQGVLLAIFAIKKIAAYGRSCCANSIFFKNFRASTRQ